MVQPAPNPNRALERTKPGAENQAGGESGAEPSIPRRSESGFCPENPAQVGLVGETGLVGDRRERDSRSETGDDPAHPAATRILGHRHPEPAAEHPSQRDRVEACLAGQPGDPRHNRFVEVFLHAPDHCGKLPPGPRKTPDRGECVEHGELDRGGLAGSNRPGQLEERPDEGPLVDPSPFPRGGLDPRELVGLSGIEQNLNRSGAGGAEAGLVVHRNRFDDETERTGGLLDPAEACERAAHRAGDRQALPALQLPLR